MSSNVSLNNIALIETDQYNCLYYILDIFKSSLIIKVTKLLVDIKASIVTIENNKRLSIEKWRRVKRAFLLS